MIPKGDPTAINPFQKIQQLITIPGTLAVCPSRQTVDDKVLALEVAQLTVRSSVCMSQNNNNL